MEKSNLINLTKDSYRLTLMFPKREPLRCKIREIADEILAGLIINNKSDFLNISRQLDIIDSFFEVARAQNWVSPPAIDEIKKNYAALRSDIAGAAVEIKIPPTTPVQENGRQAGQENVIYAPAALIPPLISRTVPIIPLTMQNEVGENAGTFTGKPPANSESVLPKEEKEKSAGAAKEQLTDGQALRQNRIVEYLKEKGQAQVWEIQKVFPNISKRTIRRDFRSLLGQKLIERVGERNKTYYKLKVNIA